MRYLRGTWLPTDVSLAIPRAACVLNLVVALRFLLRGVAQCRWLAARSRAPGPSTSIAGRRPCRQALPRWTVLPSVFLSLSASVVAGALAIEELLPDEEDALLCAGLGHLLAALLWMTAGGALTEAGGYHIAFALLLASTLPAWPYAAATASTPELLCWGIFGGVVWLFLVDWTLSELIQHPRFRVPFDLFRFCFFLHAGLLAWRLHSGSDVSIRAARAGQGLLDMVFVSSTGSMMLRRQEQDVLERLGGQSERNDMPQPVW